VRLQPRRKQWQAIAAAIAAVLAAGAVGVARWPHAWWWLILVTAAAGALVTPAVSAITTRLEQRRDTARLVRSGLQGTNGDAGDRLPTADDADLEARVHRAVLLIPYIHRDEESQIGALLQAGQPVLVVGSSMVGKTRMAATVVREMFGTRPVIIPDTKNALSSLDAADITINGALVWLVRQPHFAS